MEEYLYYGSSKQSSSSKDLSSPKHPKNQQSECSAYSKKRNEKKELLRIHNVTTSNKDKLCSMESEISKCLEKMDETNKPYIDHRQIYEIKHIYGKHGKYTQCILTTYSEYDDCLSDISLPPIPDKKEKKKEIEKEENDEKEVDVISDVSIDSKLMNEVELELNAYNDANAKSETIRTISFPVGSSKDSWNKFKKNMIQLMIYK